MAKEPTTKPDTSASRLLPIESITPVAPKTTIQEDLTTAGQRRVNLIWEITQAAMAITVTGAIIYTTVNSIASETLTNAFFLIIGFYYSRTNHAAIGGVGNKPSQPYEGR